MYVMNYLQVDQRVIRAESHFLVLSLKESRNEIDVEKASYNSCFELSCNFFALIRCHTQ